MIGFQVLLGVFAVVIIALVLISKGSIIDT
jgi:hypothetical protein